jgi:hypothetical protein
MPLRYRFSLGHSVRPKDTRGNESICQNERLEKIPNMSNVNGKHVSGQNHTKKKCKKRKPDIAILRFDRRTSGL